MWRQLKDYLTRKRFERATESFDREIKRVRGDHGRVNDAKAAKTLALHRALAQAVRS
jgi:hypothetical protein